MVFLILEKAVLCFLELKTEEKCWGLLCQLARLADLFCTLSC